MEGRTLELERDGAELSGELCASTLSGLERLLSPYDVAAGARIFGDASLAEWLHGSPVSQLVSSTFGSPARAVRAILFDKTARSNWTLGWHQDRTIAVRERVVQPGFAHWTVKSGVIHVEPPFSIIERMLTARIHLDAVTATNAPLLIAPGSHRLGRIAEGEIDAVVARCGSVPCLAAAGDVWLYRASILHASKKSSGSGSRRVLQIDFSAEESPGGLQWLGLA